MRITAPASLVGWRQICSDNIMCSASFYFKNSLCFDFFKAILNRYFVSLKSLTLLEAPKFLQTLLNSASQKVCVPREVFFRVLLIIALPYFIVELLPSVLLPCYLLGRCNPVC